MILFIAIIVSTVAASVTAVLTGLLVGTIMTLVIDLGSSYKWELSVLIMGLMTAAFSGGAMAFLVWNVTLGLFGFTA